MPLIHLEDSLKSVNWGSNIDHFLKQLPESEIIAKCNLKIAIWAKQFEKADKGNPALSFIREMQVAGMYVAVLLSLSLYKPAASSMRTTLETALYYSYYRSHLCELATLARNPDFYLQKKELLDYHKLHTLNFIKYEQCFGLIGNLNSWYSKISSIIHGQIPGGLINIKSIADIKHTDDTLVISSQFFFDCVEFVHQLFLCTVGKEFWDSFSTPAKKELIKGLPGNIKTTLGLDSA